MLLASSIVFHFHKEFDCTEHKHVRQHPLLWELLLDCDGKYIWQYLLTLGHTKSQGFHYIISGATDKEVQCTEG